MLMMMIIFSFLLLFDDSPEGEHKLKMTLSPHLGIYTIIYTLNADLIMMVMMMMMMMSVKLWRC